MSRARLSLGGLLGGCAWALASAGQAQQAPPAGGGFGPPGGPPLTVVLGTTGVYDTNVAGGDAAIARERHLPTLGDASVTPSAELDVNKTIGPEQFFVHALTAYSFYTRDTILNHEHLDVQAGGQGQFASCQGQLTGGYTRFQSELAENSVKTANNIAELEQVTFNTSCPRPIGFTPQFSVSESWVNNDSRSLQTSNRRTFQVQGGVSYARPVFGSLGLNAQYMDTTFPDRPLPTEGEDGYKLYGAGVHYMRTIGARLSADVTVNYTKLEMEASNGAAAGQGFSGPTYVANVTYTASSRWSAHVAAERDTKPSNSLNADYVLVQGVTEEVNYQVNARLTVTAGAKQLDNSYRGALLLPSTPGGLILTQDDRHDYYINTALNLTQRISVSLDVRDELRHADPADYSYHSLRTSLRLSATF